MREVIARLEGHQLLKAVQIGRNMENAAADPEVVKGFQGQLSEFLLAVTRHPEGALEIDLDTGDVYVPEDVEEEKPKKRVRKKASK